MAVLLDLEAEAARRALDGLDRRLERRRREIRHLELRDLLDLLAGHLADLRLAGLARSLLDAGRALEEHGGGRRLGDEGEGAVGVDGDDDRDDEAGLGLRLRVERLAELHDVDAALTERGADRRA